MWAGPIPSVHLFRLHRVVPNEDLATNQSFQKGEACRNVISQPEAMRGPQWFKDAGLSQPNFGYHQLKFITPACHLPPVPTRNTAQDHLHHRFWLDGNILVSESIPQTATMGAADEVAAELMNHLPQQNPPKGATNWEKIKALLDTGLNATNTAINFHEKLVPNPTNKEIAATRETIANLAAGQSAGMEKQTAATVQHVAATDAQTELLREGLSAIAKAQVNMTKEVLQSMPRQELAAITAEISSLKKELRSIANDLITFSKPSVFNHLLDAGALLTSAAAVAHIKRLADQAERMANSLDRISDNIYSEHSRGDKFPGHVHSYIRSVMEQHPGNNPPHYFFVFNPSTTWHAKFDDINRADPLGDRYLGRRCDLDELVAFIVESARPRLGPEPVIHILTPTISQLAIAESLRFPDEMRPFRVDGQLGESGLPFVYLCVPENEQDLYQVGALRPRPRWVLLQRVGVLLPFIYPWLSTELEPVFFEDPFLAVSGTVDSPIYASLYMEIDPVPPRTLGTPRQ